MALRLLAWWCTQAGHCTRQRTHLRVDLTAFLLCPSSDVLQALVAKEMPPPGSVNTDAELDAEEAGAAGGGAGIADPAADVGRGRGGRKGRGRGRGRGRA